MTPAPLARALHHASSDRGHVALTLLGGFTAMHLIRSLVSHGTFNLLAPVAAGIIAGIGALMVTRRRPAFAAFFAAFLACEWLEAELLARHAPVSALDHGLPLVLILTAAWGVLLVYSWRLLRRMLESLR